MTDQQKVQLLPCPWCGYPPISHWVGNEDGGYYEVACDSCKPKGPGAIAYMFCGVHGDDEDSCVERWNARLAAIAHASSATVKENLTVGEGEEVAWRWRDDVRPGLPWRTTPDREVMEKLRAAGCYEIEPLYTHPAPSAEDAKRLDFLEAMANQPGGVLLHDGSESGRCGIGLRPGSMHRTLREAIDQALAAERGEGNG